MEKTYFWDIETSYIITDSKNEMQVTFLSNVLEVDLNTLEITGSKFFRTIAETIEYFSLLDECIMWSHNLDYELTFLMRELVPNGMKKGKYDDMYSQEIQEVVFRDKNAPLSIKFKELPNITFRDSYALFNTSVKVLGEKLGLPKLEYNYKKVRLPWSKLTQLDYDYNERDNVIVAMSLIEYMETNNYKINEIPLTFTSEVRRKRKEFIKDNFDNKALIKFYFDRNKSYNNFSLFNDLLTVYQGGLTSSNMNYTGKIIDNISTSGVIGVDIKSSYPNQMCTRKFPDFSKSEFLQYPFSDIRYKEGLYKHFIGIAKFINIEVKNRDFILPISTSQLGKGSSVKPRFFNGKLIGADEIIIPITNIDVSVIDKVYKYDEVVMLSMHFTNTERFLRIEEVSFLLSNFMNKERNINKATSKLIINSMYGVKVSSPIKDFYNVVDGEIISTSYFDYNEQEKEEMYNNFVDSQNLYGGGLDVYSDGVYITSYARQQLIDMIVFITENGGKVVYSDTDSCKFFCNTKEEQDILLEKILSSNEEKITKNSKLPRFKQFKNKFEINDQNFNKICTLGIWEVEDEKPHKIFKTLGAKKYGYITFDDKVKTTIAGCNKKNIPLVIENVAKKNKISLEKAFKFCFNTGVMFDESASGRTTAKKEDRTFEEMKNERYKGRLINQFGGIIIKDTTYTLGITLNDSKIIGNSVCDIVSTKISLKGVIKYV